MNTDNNESSTGSDHSQNPNSAKPGYQGLDWERDLLSRLAMASLNEQRRARRWSVFFRSLSFIFIAFLLILLVGGEWGSKPSVGTGKHTALVELQGQILPGYPTDFETVGAGLRAAFEDKNTKAVILRINSPGGSPVQSGFIYDEMMRLRAQHQDIPLYAVIEDIGASGGYYIAAGAEKIYADRASIVGSIGVRMDSFGFVEALKMLGIERRSRTAGENKSLMDPFLPVSEESEQHVQKLLNDVHQQFIAAVQRSRGDRIKAQEEIYSGLVWTGKQSLELGLIDGLGDLHYVAREIVQETTIRDFTPREDMFERFARELGASVSYHVVELISSMRLR